MTLKLLRSRSVGFRGRPSMVRSSTVSRVMLFPRLSVLEVELVVVECPSLSESGEAVRRRRSSRTYLACVSSSGGGSRSLRLVFREERPGLRRSVGGGMEGWDWASMVSQWAEVQSARTSTR